MPGKGDSKRDRKYTRLEIPLPVKYRVLDGEMTEEWQESVTKDICSGGLDILIDIPIKRLTELDICVSMPDRFALDARAEVIWQREIIDESGSTRYETGIRFKYFINVEEHFNFFNFIQHEIYKMDIAEDLEHF